MRQVAVRYPRTRDDVNSRFAGSCAKWQHTGCYVEYEDCDALPELMYCRWCNTNERA